jgi:hypothetical protein
VEGAVALEDDAQLVAAQEGVVARQEGPVGRQHGPDPAGHRFEMSHGRLGADNDARTRHLGPPAQVEVGRHGRDDRVEPAQRDEEIGAHEGATLGGHEYVPHVVVLPMVDLAHRQPFDHGARLVGAHPDVQEDERVVPAHEFRRDDAGVGPQRLLDHGGDGIAPRRDVVVAEQEEAGPLDHADGLVGRRPEAGFLQAADEGVGEDPADAGRRVLATPGHQHQDGQVGVVLLGQRGEGFFEPGPGIPGHDHRHHRRRLGVHQGAEAIRSPSGVGGWNRGAAGAVATTSALPPWV